MKKFLTLTVLLTLFAFAMSSCSDDEDTCYECTQAAAPDCIVDICDEKATDCNAAVIGEGDNETLKDTYEAGGFTCRAK